MRKTKMSEEQNKGIEQVNRVYPSEGSYAFQFPDNMSDEAKQEFNQMIEEAKKNKQSIVLEPSVKVVDLNTQPKQVETPAQTTEQPKTETTETNETTEQPKQEQTQQQPTQQPNQPHQPQRQPYQHMLDPNQPIMQQPMPYGQQQAQYNPFAGNVYAQQVPMGVPPQGPNTMGQYPQQGQPVQYYPGVAPQGYQYVQNPQPVQMPVPQQPQYNPQQADGPIGQQAPRQPQQEQRQHSAAATPQHGDYTVYYTNNRPN